MEHYEVAIVGAGVSGLVVAYRLHQKGVRPLVIDPADRVGGVVRTERSQDCLLEVGPNSTLSKPAVLSLISDLGLTEELLHPQEGAKKRYLGLLSPSNECTCELAAAPEGLVSALATPILSARQKWRILGDLLSRPQKEEDEDVFAFVARHFGHGVAERVVAPMLSGIWAADISSLSARSALSSLWNYDQSHGSIIRGAVKQMLQKRSKPKEPRAKLVTFREGMQTLPNALAAVLAEKHILLRTEVQHLAKDGHSVVMRALCNGHVNRSIGAQKVVITGSAASAAHLLEHAAPALAAEIRKVPYAPLGVLHVLYKRKAVQHSLDGFGFLVPPSKPCALLGAIFSSSLFEGRAPEDMHLLTCFAGGASKPQLACVDEPEIRERVLQELGTLIGAKEEGQVVSAQYWDRSIPNYPLGHHKLQSQVDAFEQECPGIRLLGNWRRGISVADRVAEANHMADRILCELHIASDSAE